VPEIRDLEGGGKKFDEWFGELLRGNIEELSYTVTTKKVPNRRDFLGIFVH